jgi:hypothetical protein
MRIAAGRVRDPVGLSVCHSDRLCVLLIRGSTTCDEVKVTPSTHDLDDGRVYASELVLSQRVVGSDV